ncbi:MAG: hypothetical protein K0R39_2650, partial [Symbiobacteriaceae bacterium]|jgi:hypothetical protein|nr:hypothetical protein [Symbiobacteriaceae bacterium]
VADKKKSNVIPFPTRIADDEVTLEITQPPRMEPVLLLNHPDVQVTQEGERYYRIRVGEVDVTYDCSMDGRGAWYVYLPERERAVGPLTVEQFDPANQPFFLNIDVDQNKQAVGIEIV